MAGFTHFFYSFLLLHLIFLQIKSEKYAVLIAKTPSEEKTFCIVYYPKFVDLPSDKSKASYHSLYDHSDENFCYEHGQNFENQIILLSRSNSCNLITQVSSLQKQEAAAALFVISDKEKNYNFNGSEDNINITVGLIDSTSAKYLSKMEKVVAYMFAPDLLSFDCAIILIWIIAVLSVGIGGYWSGVTGYSLYLKRINKLSLDIRRENDETEAATLPLNPNDEEITLDVSLYSVIIFVICMAVMLLLMYFFYNYLVYLLIVVFVIASVVSLFSCLYPLVMKICPPSCILLKWHFQNVLYLFDYRHVLLVAVSFSFPIFWVCVRKEHYSWIPQDIMGVFFCINLLKSIRLPNLKICSVLLILLFFYDIFFVFITPLIFAKGKSVMETVATGGTSNEMFPMVVKVPHLTTNPLIVCFKKNAFYSILGFGDILIPGFLVSFCHAFDLKENKSRVYFAITLCFYGLGLFITFIALCLMNSAQPALLYIVPTMLLPLIITGFKRGQLKKLWSGFKILQNPDLNNSSSSDANITPDSAESSDSFDIVAESDNLERITSAPTKIND